MILLASYLNWSCKDYESEEKPQDNYTITTEKLKNTHANMQFTFSEFRRVSMRTRPVNPTKAESRALETVGNP
ncbi:hypothetical protein HanXRQr2_Chr10g0451211 [Helianthus annuus]|uniref:Uncharacterized protein n=1 Tax=Helianthus annuus TaxID=4232 RepID=A0A9K3HZE6_HELAN|nr:hypothetical protein HanXRQr2_Chr10g0451211 [Helianthus annuus]